MAASEFPCDPMRGAEEFARFFLEQMKQSGLPVDTPVDEQISFMHRLARERVEALSTREDVTIVEA